MMKKRESFQNEEWALHEVMVYSAWTGLEKGGKGLGVAA